MLLAFNTAAKQNHHEQPRREGAKGRKAALHLRKQHLPVYAGDSFSDSVPILRRLTLLKTKVINLYTKCLNVKTAMHTRPFVSGGNTSCCVPLNAVHNREKIPTAAVSISRRDTSGLGTTMTNNKLRKRGVMCFGYRFQI